MRKKEGRKERKREKDLLPVCGTFYLLRHTGYFPKMYTRIMFPFNLHAWLTMSPTSAISS